MSKIEWTGRSDWNPIRGCTRVSEGCRNCYAEGIAARFSGPGQPFHGFAEKTANGPRWTGKVELIEARLTLPLKWRKPARIFVNSAFDLFHESIPDHWIDRVFAIMALSPQHTFQILTKRSKRMREYFAARGGKALLIHWAEAFAPGALPITYHEVTARLDPTATPEHRALYNVAKPQWPLPNVWLGVSAEDQSEAEERIPDLLATPAARRFVSIEPMLGPIDLTSLEISGDYTLNALEPLSEAAIYATEWSPHATGVSADKAKADWIDEYGTWPPSPIPPPRLDWVIAGGESGPHARPSHPNWYRSLRDQCWTAGVAFFFKQWGEWLPAALTMRSFWPANKWHEWSDAASIRVGKRAAGSLLDRRQHKEFPAH